MKQIIQELEDHFKEIEIGYKSLKIHGYNASIYYDKEQEFYFCCIISKKIMSRDSNFIFVTNEL